MNKVNVAAVTIIVCILAAAYWLTPVALTGTYRMTYQNGPSIGCYHEMEISIGGDASGKSVCPVNAPPLKWSGTVTRRGNHLMLQVGPAVSEFQIEGRQFIDHDGPFVRVVRG